MSINISDLDKFNSTSTFTTETTSFMQLGTTRTAFYPQPVQFIVPPKSISQEEILQNEEKIVEEKELHRTISLKRKE